MNKTILAAGVLLVTGTHAYAASQCFIAKENDKIILQEGDCKTRYAPQSTFKIPLSLMGYDAGILESETRPEWPYKAGYYDYPKVCKEAHNPHAWMRDSCVWYSQVLAEKLGIGRLKTTLAKFSYGNQDLSGDPGRGNGLIKAWISSSLLISPEEQLVFISKLAHNQLPVSAKSLEMTKKLLYTEELSGGWKLYGKTGNGKNKNEIQQGWYVGWIEKDGRILSFVKHIEDDTKQEIPASFRSKDQARHELWKWIESDHS
jgi:beta-lactamase class D